MSADHKHPDEALDTVIPISEWPVSCSQDTELRNVSKRNRDENEIRVPSSGINICRKARKRFKYSHSLKDNRNDDSKLSSQKQTQESRDNDSWVKEPDVASKIAKWWRQKKASEVGKADLKIPKCSPNSMIFHISRLPECRAFLEKERKRLLHLLTLPCNTADICAALASLNYYTEQFTSAQDYITQAIQHSPSYTEYHWLMEMISRQCQMQKKQVDWKRLTGSAVCHFPSAIEVPRIAGVDLSIEDFQEKYLETGSPVIITDVADKMTKVPFDFSLIFKYAGHKAITTKETNEDSLIWAKLESKQETTIAELIKSIQAGGAKDVLFDWSLPIHSPELAEQISLPLYFKDNLLLQTSPGSMYRESWPSLFIAPKGATTELHVDAFHSHFWMALFQGEKRWTFFDQEDTPFLYPRWFQSMDPVFEVDLSQPDMEKFPLLARTRPQQCVLRPGDLLFVPAGSPHYVENLTPTLAISSNYVNHTNFDKVCEELNINAMQDERAKDLLQQLQDPAFLCKVQLQRNKKS